MLLSEDLNEVQAVLSKGDPSLFGDCDPSTPASTFKCLHCNKTFSTRMALSQHKKKHAMIKRVMKKAGPKRHKRE